MRSLFRSLGTLLGFALVALALVGPATAWDGHAITHLSAPVAVDAHHHHDDDGSVIAVDDSAGGSHNPSEEDDGGHDHMPSHSAAMSGIPAQGPVLPLRLSAMAATAEIEAQEPPDLPATPQKRPPRFV